MIDKNKDGNVNEDITITVDKLEKDDINEFKSKFINDNNIIKKLQFKIEEKEPYGDGSFKFDNSHEVIKFTKNKIFSVPKFIYQIT